MVSIGAVLLIVVSLLLITIFIIVLATSVSTPEIPSSGQPIQIPGLGPCTPIEGLIDVSDEQCCLVGGQRSSVRYSEELNAVVGPTATIWTQACNTLTDQTEIEQCYIDLKPDSCNSKAASVARVGIARYYIRNYGNGGCTSVTDC